MVKFKNILFAKDKNKPKLLFCSASSRGKYENAGHYFNKKNICIHCKREYADLVTTDPNADGKVIY